MKLEASHLDEEERPRAAAMKFAYPSGSRPLAGYTIKRGVGSGGFGEVYFATSDAGKEVALKLIRRNLDVELRGVTQCLNLKHPNLIGVFDIRTDEMGDQWVIMEYVSGESLDEAIDRHPNGMPLEQVLWWLRGVCAGVAYLHDHGIVHRDLKPGNIFRDEDTVKIGDYGLAKFISCSRRSGQTESVGTVHYMAPEIANGRYGREIDTYALGIILFEMLTGRVPFEGESVGEVLMKHLTAEPDLSALSEPYRDIVRRALAKDPAERLKSVGEMLSLLPGGGDASSAPPLASALSPGAAKPWAPSNTDDDVTIEEPIWKAIREGAAKLRARWHGEEVERLHPVAKALVILAVVWASLSLSGIVIGIAFPLAMCYGIYYLIWITMIRPGMRKQALVDRHSAAAAFVAGTADIPRASREVAWQRSNDADPAASPAERYARAARKRRSRSNWRDRANLELAAKPTREKLSELLGSMLMAAMCASVAALVAPLLFSNQPVSERIAAHLWLAAVGTLGSWAILIPTKFAEGKMEDHVPMRITMLMLGALVGMAGWFLGDALLLQTPNWGDPMSVDRGLLSDEMFKWARPIPGANPSLAVYVAYFAFLFLLLRWWRNAEYTRNTRLSMWSVVVCIFWAWLLQFFWWFPQPMGMMAAGVIAFSTQLASPWLPPSRRRTLSGEMEQPTV
jgi:hypothetical protein